MCRVLLISTIAASLACGGDPEPSEQTRVRPVSAINLEPMNPARDFRLTGSVEPWKDAILAFEVPGRIEWIAEAGTVVQGQTRAEGRLIVAPGDAVARLDTSRYELQLASAKARHQAAEAMQESVRFELEGVVAEQLMVAKAELDRARKDFERIGSLAHEGVLSPSEGDRAEAEFTAADANHRQILAKSQTKSAELKMAEARTLEALVAVNQAELDLQSCTLIAPFSGQIAETYASSGAQVQQGQSVLTLVVMNPLKIEIAVSPETERKIHFGDVAMVFPPGSDRPVPGSIHFKDTVADSATRTYKATIMVQNHQTLGSGSPGASGEALPEFERAWPVLQVDIAGHDRPFVEAGTLQQDEHGDFVWQVEGAVLGKNWKDQSPTLSLTKRYVEPGVRSYSLLGLLTFRELLDVGDLQEGTLLASGVPESVQEGTKVLLARRNWLMRPGDLVQISFEDEGPGEGIYVPMEAIMKEQDRHFVFVIDEGSEGDHRARKVPIELGENVDQWWKIENEELRAGETIVIGGAHYLVDGERVRPVPAEAKLR